MAATISMVVLSAVQGDRPRAPLPTSPSQVVPSAPPAVLSQAPLPMRAERD